MKVKSELEEINRLFLPEEAPVIFNVKTITTTEI